MPALALLPEQAARVCMQVEAPKGSAIAQEILLVLSRISQSSSQGEEIFLWL